jgi:hypothetical protein
MTAQRSPRSPFPHRMQVRRGSDQIVKVAGENISATGVAFVSPERLEVGELISLGMLNEPAGARLTQGLVRRVVETGTGFLVGVEQIRRIPAAPPSDPFVSI